MRAVASGLLGLGFACDDKAPEQEPDPERHEHDANLCGPAPTAAGRGAAAGESSTGHAQDAGTDSGKVAHGGATSEPDKELSKQNVQLTNTELVKMCDERQGYVQIHGSCSGVNTCRGFFYGDWDEDAELIEHTCSGVNGCAGLSCLTTAEPAGDGMTGEEIMKLDDAWFEERGGQYGPKACKTCHVVSEFNEEKQDYDYDFSKLKVPVWASSGRNASNWLKRPAAYQEALIAFGAQGITEEGIRYSNMASYAKLFSKVEIQRVVQYMRGFAAKDITFKEIKLHPGKTE
jgi:hypothetical protein